MRILWPLRRCIPLRWPAPFLIITNWPLRRCIPLAGRPHQPNETHSPVRAAAAARLFQVGSDRDSSWLSRACCCCHSPPSGRSRSRQFLAVPGVLLLPLASSRQVPIETVCCCPGRAAAAARLTWPVPIETVFAVPCALRRLSPVPGRFRSGQLFVCCPERAATAAGLLQAGSVRDSPPSRSCWCCRSPLPGRFRS